MITAYRIVSHISFNPRHERTILIKEFRGKFQMPCESERTSLLRQSHRPRPKYTSGTGKERLFRARTGFRKRQPRSLRPSPRDTLPCQPHDTRCNQPGPPKMDSPGQLKSGIHLSEAGDQLVYIVKCRSSSKAKTSFRFRSLK